MKKSLKNMTKDTLSTLVGCVAGVLSGAATGAATTYLQGGVTKEALIAGAVVGAAPVVAGYLHNLGNTEKAFK